MKLRITKKAGFVLAIAGAAVLGGAATAIVQAAIPSTSDGQIHACYRNSASLTDAKGALRVVDSQATPAQNCTAQETALNFNQSAVGGIKKDLSNYTYVTGSNFAFLDLRGVNFTNSDANTTNFRSADLRDANFTNTILTGSDMSAANMSSLSISGAEMSSVNLTGANLTGVHFTSVNLSSAVFTDAITTGVAWTNTTCPDGSNSNDNGNTCVGHLNL